MILQTIFQDIFFLCELLIKKNQFNKANLILNYQLQGNPKNLLLNQLKLDINSKKSFKNDFNCKKYIAYYSRALFILLLTHCHLEEIYSISNFYLSLSQLFKPKFFFL